MYETVIRYLNKYEYVNRCVWTKCEPMDKNLMKKKFFYEAIDLYTFMISSLLNFLLNME